MGQAGGRDLVAVRVPDEAVRNSRCTGRATGGLARRGAQRVQQLECQLADCRGAAVVESRAAQEELASLRAVLLSQAERLGLQIQGAAAAAARESSWLGRWSGEL